MSVQFAVFILILAPLSAILGFIGPNALQGRGKQKLALVMHSTGAMLFGFVIGLLVMFFAG